MEMLELQCQADGGKQQFLVKVLQLLARCSVSFILVFLTQSALLLVPRFFSATPLLLQLFLSGLVLLLITVLGRWCRRLVGVYASAPAFVVFTILFIWGVYFFLFRQAVPHFMNILFNGEMAMLLLGMFRILWSDPGLVTYKCSMVECQGFEADACNEIGSKLVNRVRYCRRCKAYIKGFDHHCPAFGNCIGQNNYALFMVLLVGFVATEVSYVVCVPKISRRSQISGGITFETNLADSLLISTMLFSLLQILWQGCFMAWHVYCVCFNIRTDEWINWKRYPEFQLKAQSQPEQSITAVRFRNPYDKGILQNVKEFLGVES